MFPGNVPVLTTVTEWQTGYGQSALCIRKLLIALSVTKSVETMSKPSRDACGRFIKGPSQGPPKGPSQGQPKGPSQGQPKGPSQGLRDASASAEEGRTFYGGRADETDSDSESVISIASSIEVEEGSRSQSRKRAFLKEGSDGSSASGSAKEPKKKAKAKKPVTEADTHDVGLADAKRQLDLARREQIQQELEEHVAAKEARARVARAKSGYGASRVLYADHSLAELEQMALEDEEGIVEVASKSSHLKGTFQKSLKCRAVSMRSIVAELVQRQATDETRQLQARVDRLQTEVSQLHQKLAEATARPTQAEPRPAAEGPASSFDLEDAIRKVMLEERDFVRACLAGIEDRLLPEKSYRLPLAADKRRGEPEPTSQREEDSLLPAATPANPAGWTKVVGKGKGKGKGATAAVPVVPATATPPSQSQSTGKGKGKGKGKGATAVVPAVPAAATPPSQSQTAGKGRGKGKGTGPPPKAASAAPTAKTAGTRRKLVPPKTAAVVVTLTAEAAARGETYASILLRARANADPTQLGIGKVSCRRTQAGARIFEFPGAEGSANADLFATKLQEVIADAAKVARPVKTVAIEVSDLDDTVTKEEVVAAVAALGGCGVAAVRSRDIRSGRGGMGTIRMECPVAAAKAVLDKGRLSVGFSSGAVRALVAQPLRCYRCCGIGHTRALCPSTVDRTESCYRCGKEGHKSAECEAAAPHCSVCAASGRPAGHIMKGRMCNPPPKKGKLQAPSKPAASVAVPEIGLSAAAGLAVEEGGAMSDG